MPTFFRCSKGRREFDPFESAIACEESHREVVTAKAKQYTVSPYPFMIEVTFTDGDTKDYIADDMH